MLLEACQHLRYVFPTIAPDLSESIAAVNTATLSSKMLIRR